MPRKTFNPDKTDPKFEKFLEDMTGMAEVGDWLTLAGYEGERLHNLRKKIIKEAEVINIKENYLITGAAITTYLKAMKKSGKG